jgi:hypothetical protein
MPRRNYDYLGEGNISIDAPTDILERVERNLEEKSNDNSETQGIVYVTKGRQVEIKKTEDNQYLWTRQNSERDYEGVDYMRYKAHVQTIWKENPRRYHTISRRGVEWNGALDCFKKIYYDTEGSQNKALVHGALVNIGGKGIFLVGGCRSGKSTLMMNLLEGLGGSFVTEGNTLLESNENRITGFYLPREVYLRFSSIENSERLRQSMEEIGLCEATQPIDIEAIKRIIQARAFHVDAGLNYSRSRFSELLEVERMSSSPIDKIVFTSYAQGHPLTISRISDIQALDILQGREFPKNTAIGGTKHQSEIEPPTKSLIDLGWIEQVDHLSISHNGNEDLTKSVLEDLI